MPQEGEGIRVSTAAVPGGAITVNVGPNDETVEVSVSGSGGSTSYNVPGNKDTQIPVPQVAPGTTLTVRVGKGSRKRRILVHIVAPSP